MNQSSLDNAVLLRPDVWAVDNLFDQTELISILHDISTEQDWQLVELQEHMPRQSIVWTDNGVLDRLWSMLNELDFGKFGIKFKNVTVWKDVAPYCIADHVDNDRVVAAMQIYLNEGPMDIGTWFEDCQVPFVGNSGYIMHNRNKLMHGMKTPVPDGFVRYSMYALFDAV